MHTRVKGDSSSQYLAFIHHCLHHLVSMVALNKNSQHFNMAMMSSQVDRGVEDLQCGT